LSIEKAEGNAFVTIDNMGDIAAGNSSRIVLRMIDAMGQKAPTST